METLLEREKENADHLIRPEALESELKKIKVNPEELRSDGTFDELLTEGRKTSRLVVARFSVADTEIEYKARLASQLQTDGTLQLSIHPVKMSLNEQLDNEFMNHYFSQKEKDNLKLFGHGGEVILLTVNGVETPCLVSADRLTNEVVAIEQKKVVIPDFYKNVELSQLNKESLSQGQPTFVKDVTTPEGFTLSGLIVYDADRQRLELLEYGLTLTQIHNVKLDKDQQQLLSEGKTILVPNIIDGKGEEYSAWIRLDMKSREIGLSKVLPEQKIEKEKKIKPSNDYRVQVNQNSHGIQTEENKFKIDPLKSGEVRDPEIQQKKVDDLVPLLVNWIQNGTKYPEQETKSIFSFFTGKNTFDHLKIGIQRISIKCLPYCSKQETDKIESKLLQTAEQFNKQLSSDKKLRL